MSNVRWHYVIAIGYITSVTILAASVSFSLRPGETTYPARPAVSASSCGYEDARSAAYDARERRDNPPEGTSEPDRRKAAEEAEAAERQQQDARVCEERANESADLEAQWASAAAAQNAAAVAQSVYRWAGWELGAVLLALGAAAWAAYETRRSSKISQDIGDAQLRPYPIIKYGSTMSMTVEQHSIIFDFEFPVFNAGQSPVTELTFQYHVYVWQAGLGYPTTQNKLRTGPKTQLAALAPGDEGYKVREVDVINKRDMLEAIMQNSSDQLSDVDAVFAIRVEIDGSDMSGSLLAPYVVWLEHREWYNVDVPATPILVEFEAPRRKLRNDDKPDPE